MEIIEEDDEEIKRLMLRISNKEITLCETCDALFDYIPQKVFCDECMKAKKSERMRKYSQRPEVKAKRREYQRKYYQRPEVKAMRSERMRKYYQRPEVKAGARERDQRPEVKAKRRERYLRNKKLREEE